VNEYKLGDLVWVASYESREGKEPCPVCFGKLVVTLILGNDERVVLPCDYCGHGFNEPRGYVTVYERLARVESAVITEVRARKTSTGIEYEYRGGSWCLDASRVFGTEEQAQAHAEELAKAEQLCDETSPERVKRHVQHTYSWNAGYHLREVAEARKSMEYHGKMAKICKERSRDTEKEGANA